MVALQVFASFDELYRELPLLKCGYTQADVGTAAPRIWRAITPKKSKQNAASSASSSAERQLANRAFVGAAHTRKINFFKKIFLNFKNFKARKTYDQNDTL